MAKFAKGNQFEFKISRMSDAVQDDVPSVPFAIAVSLEASGVAVYDQVLSQIDIAFRPLIPQPVVVGAGPAE